MVRSRPRAALPSGKALSPNFAVAVSPVFASSAFLGSSRIPAFALTISKTVSAGSLVRHLTLYSTWSSGGSTVWCGGIATTPSSKYPVVGSTARTVRVDVTKPVMYLLAGSLCTGVTVSWPTVGTPGVGAVIAVVKLGSGRSGV